MHFLHISSVSLLSTSSKDIKILFLPQPYKLMFIEVLFTSLQNCKPYKCQSTGEWVDRLWYTHMVEFYSVMKRNKLPMEASTWKHLQAIVLSNVNLYSRIYAAWFHVPSPPVAGTAGRRSVVVWGRTWRWKLRSEGHKGTAWVDENVLGLDWSSGFMDVSILSKLIKLSI